jgi:hypothetical protein
MDILDRLLDDLQYLSDKHKRVLEKIENPDTSQAERLELYGEEFKLIVDISSVHEDLMKAVSTYKGPDALKPRRVKKAADSLMMTGVIGVF